MNQNTLIIELDPETKQKIDEIYAMFSENRSGKQKLSEDWLQLTEIAEVLGVSTKTARRHLKNAGIVGTKPGRILYFHREQVEKLLGK